MVVAARFPEHQRFGDDHWRPAPAFAMHDDGSYPPLGGGAGGIGSFPAGSAPKPDVRGAAGAPNVAPARGPHVAPPSAGSRLNEAIGYSAAHEPHVPPADTPHIDGYQAAEERALAAALAASRIQEGPRRPPPAAAAPALAPPVPPGKPGGNNVSCYPCS